MGVAGQSAAPAEVVVSCDNDLEEIAEVVRGCSHEFERRISIVQRGNMGECRVGQARNNGVRGLVALGAVGEDRVLYLDGDCCPGGDVTKVHLMRGTNKELLIGFRIELTPEQTDEEFDEGHARSGRYPVKPTEEQMASLAKRDGRYRRQLWLKKFGMTKAHKPKILSAHFSVRLAAVLKVNGFDEQFVGWGQEDDDLGRRLHESGASADIVVKEAVVFHQWHPTRAPGAWKDSMGVERFAKRLAWRCARGIEDPVEQGAVVMRVFEGGREIQRREIGRGMAAARGVS